MSGSVNYTSSSKYNRSKSIKLTIAIVLLAFQVMGASIFSILFFCIMSSNTEAFKADCSPVKCRHCDIDVRSPFRAKSMQPQHCGSHGFELVCKENSTMINFPSYGELAVKSISYDTNKLDLLDPKNCVHEVFLNLNLSLTPFHYYYVVKNYTYLNCSAKLPPPFTEIPCLSGSGHLVYTVESSSAVPDSCRAIKTVAIPFAHSSYLADGSFGLGLTWGIPGCHDRKAEKTGFFGLAQSKVLIMSMFLLMVAILISFNIHYIKKLDGQAEKKNLLKKSLSEDNALSNGIC